MSSAKFVNIDKRGLVKSFVPEEKTLVRGNLAGSVLIFPNNTVTPFTNININYEENVTKLYRLMSDLF